MLSDKQKKALKAHGLSLVAEGKRRLVAITKKVAKEKGKRAPPRDWAATERWMKHWCDERSIPQENFRPNVYRKAGLRVDEFKKYQVRIYGCEIEFEGHTLFCGTAFDLKKQDQADRKVFDLAADRCASVRDGIFEKKGS